MSIPDASDAWVLRRLLSDQPINGELAALAEPWKSIVEHLAGLPIEGRGGAWSAWLAGRSDKEAIDAALMNVDPMGDQPPPEATVGAGTAARGPGMVMRRASEIEPLPVEWL